MAEMKPVWWMAGLSAASAGLISAMWANGNQGAGFRAEIWLGMLAPLVAASVSWVFAVRTYARHPEWLTSVMMMSFAAKLVLFGAYVGLAIAVLRVRPVPFAASFTAYFIALHAAEAACLQRLFSERMRAA
jgi:hypothetical protein